MVRPIRDWDSGIGANFMMRCCSSQRTEDLKIEKGKRKMGDACNEA